MFSSMPKDGNIFCETGCSGDRVMDREDASSVGEDEEQAEKVCRKDTPGPLPDHQYDRVSWCSFQLCVCLATYTCIYASLFI